MNKLAIAFAGLAAIGFSGAAFAEEASTGSWAATTGPAAMTDSEMDGVTAAGMPNPTGEGLNTAGQATAGARGAAVFDIPAQAPPDKGIGKETRLDGPAAP